MKRVLIRADSSSNIGTGHIMRDLVLAKREFGEAEVLFAVQDLPGNINGRIREAGYALRLLESDDIEELVELVKRERIDTVVIDHYGIDAEMERQLKEATGVTLWALDDTYERHYCDILLNHNISADAKRYRGLVPKHCELRCGVEYTLLRDEFYEVKSEPKTVSEKFRILISMGGADSANLNIDILKVLGHYPDIIVEIVTSTANKNLEELKEYVADKDWIVLHIDTDRMARLMKLCDFAIVTPSVTVNEVIFMDLPFLAVNIADNQNEVYRYLKSHGYDVCIYRKENKLSFLKGLENVILQRVGK